MQNTIDYVPLNALLLNLGYEGDPAGYHGALFGDLFDNTARGIDPMRVDQWHVSPVRGVCVNGFGEQSVERRVFNGVLNRAIILAGVCATTANASSAIVATQRHMLYIN